jgi:hypothetical protein
MFALFRFALLIVFIAAAWICLAQDQVSRVVILGGNVTIEVPAGWEVVEGERKCLVGPKDAPFISMGYFRASPPTDDAVVDAAFAKHFVQNNLKVEKCEGPTRRPADCTR